MNIYQPTVDCGPLPSPPNGNVATPSGTTVGNVALYSCDEELVLIGSTVRFCGNNGLWAPDTPTCEGQWYFVEDLIYGELFYLIICMKSSYCYV